VSLDAWPGHARACAVAAAHLAKGGGDGAGLEADGGVVAAIDVADEHVHLGVVARGGEREHLVKVLAVGEQRHQAPQRAAAQARAAHALKLGLARDLPAEGREAAGAGECGGGLSDQQRAGSGAGGWHARGGC